MKRFSARMALACWMAGQPVVGVVAQTTFELDTTFRVPFQARNIIDALLLPDGDVVLSGGIRVEGDEEGILRGGVRVDPDGTRDLSFPTVSYMGAHLTPWQDKLYAGGSGIRRLNMNDFSLDPTWDLINAPLISLFQYGQYHVFPDGRVLMSGLHDLSDTERGFVGSYELIWLTNTGQLDTTRIHRNANGTILRLKQTYDGKFMCYTYGTLFDGHPVPRVFRVNADGSWDSTFVAPFPSFTGYCFGFYPLLDGRCYAAGQFIATGSTDTLYVVRFMPDGSLDPTFHNETRYELPSSIGTNGALLVGVLPLADNRLVVYGVFERANGHLHRGICMIDSTGNVLPEFFPGDGCSPYNYLGSNYCEIDGVEPTGDGDLYIWGAYRGYDDGTVNDTLQRLISRLHIPDLSTGSEHAEPVGHAMAIHPNPAHATTTVELDGALPQGVLVLRDALGRAVWRQVVQGHTVTLSVQTLGAGVYTIELLQAGQRVGMQRLVVQH